MVAGTTTRLNAADRDTLYEARINPIANFPGNEFVIFGQKTTQIARTALDRVNVRRLMIDIKTKIQRIAQGLLFEQNNQQTRDRFISPSGWLSFTAPIPNSTYEIPDNSYGMKRTEVKSLSSDIHLGHVFDDGPNGMPRYCINATVLEFIARNDLQNL